MKTMETKLSLDFETRSDIDLPNCGVYKYAADKSTGIYCLAWAFDGEEPKIWLPGQPFPKRIIKHVKAGGPVWAFNSAFERLIWNSKMDAPPLTIDQVFCTAAQGRVSSLPDSLSNQARALGSPLQKTDGMRLIRTYSIPNIPWEQIPKEDQDLFIAYCLQDVRVERAIASATRPMTETEWLDFHITERINDRGVPVDVEFASAAVEKPLN